MSLARQLGASLATGSSLASQIQPCGLQGALTQLLQIMQLRFCTQGCGKVRMSRALRMAGTCGNAAEDATSFHELSIICCTVTRTSIQQR